MQTIWGRAAQARSSCRCPSCSFAHRSIPRRRTTTSIAQNLCSSTTGFAVSFSTAVAGASYLDVRHKQQRREALEQSILEARAEVRAIVENQEARLRALEEKFKQTTEDNTRPTAEEPASNIHHDVEPLEQDLLELRKFYGLPSIDLESEPLHFEEQQSQQSDQPPTFVHTASYYQDILNECKKALLKASEKKNQALLQRGEGMETDGGTNIDDLGRHVWELPPSKYSDPLKPLQMMPQISCLIHQLELLEIYLHRTSQSTQRQKESQILGSDELRSLASKKLSSINALTSLGSRVARFFKDVPHKERHLAASDISQMIGNNPDVEVFYQRWHLSSRHLSEIRKQEDELLRLFQRRCDSLKLLRNLIEFLKSNEVAPSINMLNTMIIRLCDYGLPCAARVALDCIRRSPLRANAVTDEAAFRYALLDRNVELFVEYYDSMTGKNKAGWHNSTPQAVGEVQQAMGHLLWGAASEQLSTAAARTTHGADEAIIRNFLRLGRMQYALEEYLFFLEKGRQPSLRLMESFLRSCHAEGDVNTALEIWQQICFLYEKPSSAAYYWMLNLLAAPKKGRRAEKSNAATFEELAEDLVHFYPLSERPDYDRFRQLGTSRREVHLIADDIEALSSHQWVPGMPANQPLPADLLDAEATLRPSRRIRLKTLAHYVARQRELLQQQVEFEGEIHTTRMARDFYSQFTPGPRPNPQPKRQLIRKIAEKETDGSESNTEQGKAVEPSILARAWSIVKGAIVS